MNHPHPIDNALVNRDAREIARVVRLTRFIF
jgi:hypothetical protein